ncbi:hypothetical protein WJX82_003104 [Trebouxia sp. C0006]
MSRRFESRELPYTVLEDIFRSIGFHDRLRNPSVSLYRGMAPDQNPRPWLADQTWSGIQTPDDLLFVVPVTKSSPDVPSAAHSFVAWLFRRAAGLDELNPMRIFIRKQHTDFASLSVIGQHSDQLVNTYHQALSRSAAHVVPHQSDTATVVCWFCRSFTA